MTSISFGNTHRGITTNPTTLARLKTLRPDEIRYNSVRDQFLPRVDRALVVASTTDDEPLLSNEAFDPTAITLSPSLFSAITLTQYQIDFCLRVIFHYFGEKCPGIKTSTEIYHAVANYNPVSVPPTFFSKSDFHHSLMNVHQLWRAMVQASFKKDRQALHHYSTNADFVPDRITADDSYLSFFALRKLFLKNGPLFNRKAARMNGFSEKVVQIFYGTNGTRRNYFISRWKNIGKTINDPTQMMVPPKEVEDFFYQIMTVDMVSNWDGVSDMESNQKYTEQCLEKEYTKTFIQWFSTLDDACDPVADSSVSSTSSSTSSSSTNTNTGMFKKGVRIMIEVAVNTKMAAIHAYENAKSLPGSTNFRGRRAVEAQKKVTKERKAKKRKAKEEEKKKPTKKTSTKKKKKKNKVKVK